MRSNKNNSDKQRQCTKCKNIFILSEENFGKETGRLFGLSYLCKSCEKKRGHEKYLKNPRKYRYSLLTKEQKKHKQETEKIYFRTPKGRAISLLKAYRRHDKKKNRSNNLTQNFLIDIFKQSCYYCGLNDEPIGCERIDNNKGHIIDNIVACCRTCNIARDNHFTVEEMKILGKSIREIKLMRNSSAILKVS